MSGAQLKAILLGVVVLLALWGATELFSRRPDHTSSAARLPAVHADSVDTIAIVRPRDTILLARQGSGWLVNGLRASSSAVNDLFTAVRDTTRPELAAQSPSSFARMGVDSAGGRLVRLRGRSRTLAEFIVGGPGSEAEEFYVRFPHDSSVYAWHGQLGALAQRSVDDWRDHEIAALVPDSVSAVDVRRGAKRFTLARSGRHWTLARGAPADSGAVARLLDRLRSVRASGFASPAKIDSLRRVRPARTLSVRGPGGRPLLALDFDSSAGTFWVRGAGEATVYRLDSWQVDQLTPAEDAFQPAKRPQ